MDSSLHDQIRAVFDFSKLTPAASSHLQRVYVALMAGMALASLGAYADQFLRLGGLLTTLGSLFCLMGAMNSPFGALPPSSSSLGVVTSSLSSSRKGQLYSLFCLLQGFSLGPLLSLVVRLHPHVPLYALAGTTLIFGCFSLSVLVAPSRGRLLLGGFLGSAVSLMMLMGFANMFVRSASVALFELYLGLIIFSLYVIYDTQLIIERANVGSKDFISDALTLFTDFVAIFVRLLIILSNKEEKKERKRR